MATPEAQSQAALTPSQALVRQVRMPDFQEQVALALPEHVSPRRFVRAAVTLVLANPDIAEATTNSIFESLIRCAQDGLMPDGRQAAIVAFRDNKTNTKKATYLPMIGGYRAIAADHGWTLTTAVVYEHDEFEYELGEEPKLTHRAPRPGVDRGEMIAAYAVGRHKDYETMFAVLDAKEIARARAVSRAPEGPGWKNWPDRMWEKTAGKYLFKRLALGELDERAKRLLAADDTPPAEAATLVYGGGPHRDIEASATPRAEQPASQPAAQADEAAAEAAAPTGGDGTAEPAAAAPADQEEPVDEPVFEPAEEPGSQFSPPDQAAQDVSRAAAEAGLVRLTGGMHKGMTIAQIHEEKTTPDKNGVPEGEGYIRYCVKRWKNDEERAALIAYARVHFPDALGEGQAA